MNHSHHPHLIAVTFLSLLSAFNRVDVLILSYTSLKNMKKKVLETMALLEFSFNTNNPDFSILIFSTFVKEKLRRK